ncbi:MAG TPA: squalene/phytoene synthase family protein, partial [Thermohalobaculum sp.]|nr:squalene/phytoene synthase family protein [Thermohalobaculum sp.]
MAEPELGPIAALVRRDDPLLFRTALFAAEPGRGRLMTLYAFDIELSRALSRTREPMIARMRLQWWRDVVEAAAAGGAPRRHEVAAPLHALVADGRLSRPALDGLIEAREAELEGLDDRGAFEAWATRRFGGLIALAAESLGAGAGPVADAADAAGRAMAAAFVLRHAGPMAAEGRAPLLPGAGAESRRALARGETDAEMRAAAS